VAPLQPLADYEALYARNPDFFGWIRVEGTNVDLPVMYNPKMPLQYLGHDFDGKFSYAGVPFLEPECDPDGSYYLIYGHHMRDGTVFAELLKYEDPEFWAQHPTFRCDTRFEHRTYEVIAAFRARVLTTDEPGFRYYNYTALSDEETFQEFITNVRAMAAYDTGVEAVFGDDILTLSTCAYHTRLGRFVIVAKRVVEE
jgi:sortase B